MSFRTCSASHASRRRSRQSTHSAARTPDASWMPAMDRAHGRGVAGLAANASGPLQWPATKQGHLVCGVRSGFWIMSVRSASTPGFSDSDRTARAVGAGVPNPGRASRRGPRPWWPRRPLATLGRKSRQGRKAATVSIDAGAEVSRRGRHLFGPRILCAASPAAAHGPASATSQATATASTGAGRIRSSPTRLAWGDRCTPRPPSATRGLRPAAPASVHPGGADAAIGERHARLVDLRRGGERPDPGASAPTKTRAGRQQARVALEAAPRPTHRCARREHGIGRGPTCEPPRRIQRASGAPCPSSGCSHWRSPSA